MPEISSIGDTPPPVSSPILLSGAQRRALRKAGHHLSAVVQIGKNGLTDGLVQATAVALEQHELIKISISRESPVERHDCADELAEQTGSHVAQVIGRIVLLYRRRLENPTVALPGPIAEAAAPAPRAP